MRHSVRPPSARAVGLTHPHVSRPAALWPCSGNCTGTFGKRDQCPQRGRCSRASPGRKIRNETPQGHCRLSENGADRPEDAPN